MSDKLKPCPFCGEKAELMTIYRDIKQYRVECKSYCVETCAFVDKNHVIKLWNRRVKSCAA